MLWPPASPSPGEDRWVAHTLCCSAETEPNRFRKCYSRAEWTCGCFRGKARHHPAPLHTFDTALHPSVSISMYSLEVRTPRGSVVLSPRSLEDSSRWPGLNLNNSAPQAPSRPAHFCQGILCQTFKILINLHSDLPDPKEDGWGSRWPFTCSSICPATVDPLKRQLGRNLLPQFWRLASSPLYPFLSSLYTLAFLSHPHITFLSLKGKLVLFLTGEGKKMTLSKYHLQYELWK